MNNVGFSLTNQKPVMRGPGQSNAKRDMRAAFLSSLSIVVSKYGTDYPQITKRHPSGGIMSGLFLAPGAFYCLQ